MTSIDNTVSAKANVLPRMNSGNDTILKLIQYPLMYEGLMAISEGNYSRAKAIAAISVGTFALNALDNLVRYHSD